MVSIYRIPWWPELLESCKSSISMLSESFKQCRYFWFMTIHDPVLAKQIADWSRHCGGFISCRFIWRLTCWRLGCILYALRFRLRFTLPGDIFTNIDKIGDLVTNRHPTNQKFGFYEFYPFFLQNLVLFMSKLRIRPKLSFKGVGPLDFGSVSVHPFRRPFGSFPSSLFDFRFLPIFL